MGRGLGVAIKEIVFMNFIETSRKQRPPPVEVQVKERFLGSTMKYKKEVHK